MSAPSGLTAGRLGQGRLPIHAQGAVQRISGAGWADEVGGQTIGRVALFAANLLRGSAAGGWLPGGAVASACPEIQGTLGFGRTQPPVRSGQRYAPGGIVSAPDQEATLPESIDTPEDDERADDALAGPDLDNPAPPTTEERKSRLRGFLGILGPGLVTGVADDDPSGVATYSQAGAAFGVG